MKRTLLAAMLSSAFCAFSALAADLSKTWTLDTDWFRNVNIADRGEGYFTPEVSGWLVPAEPVGAPAFPRDTVQLALPSGATVTSVDVDAEWVPLSGAEGIPYPILEPVTTDAAGLSKPVPDAAYYDLPTYPASPVENLGVQIANGESFISIAITPFRWISPDGGDHHLERASSLSVTVTYTAPIRKSAVKKAAIRKASSGEVTDANADVIILSPEAFTNIWKTYVEFRSATHPQYKFLIKNCSECYTPEGRSNPQVGARDLHHYLESAYEQHNSQPFYVILGGACPCLKHGAQKWSMDNLLSFNYREELPTCYYYNGGTFDQISDMYYACMDKMGGAEVWDSDGDGVYMGTMKEGGGLTGEPNAKMDWMADLKVMRIPLRSVIYEPAGGFTAQAQMNNLINKIRLVEGNEWDASYDYLLIGAEDLFGSHRWGTTTEQYLSEAEFFDNARNVYDPDHPTASISNEIEERHRHSTIMTSVHTNNITWSVAGRTWAEPSCGYGGDVPTTYFKNGNDAHAISWKRNWDVKILESHGAPRGAHPEYSDLYFSEPSISRIIVASLPCTTGGMDFSMDNNSWQATCLGAAAVLAPGGSVASFNNGRVGCYSGYNGMSSGLEQAHLNTLFTGSPTGVVNSTDAVLLNAADSLFVMRRYLQTRGYGTTGGRNGLVLGSYIGFGDPFVTITPPPKKDNRLYLTNSLPVSAGVVRSTVGTFLCSETFSWEAAGGSGRFVEFQTGNAGKLVLPGTKRRYFGRKWRNTDSIEVTGFNTTLDFGLTSENQTSPVANLSYVNTGGTGADCGTNTLRAARTGNPTAKFFPNVTPVANGTLRLEATTFGAFDLALTNALLLVAPNPCWAATVYGGSMDLNNSDFLSTIEAGTTLANASLNASAGTCHVRDTGMGGMFRATGTLSLSADAGATLAFDASLAGGGAANLVVGGAGTVVVTNIPFAGFATVTLKDTVSLVLPANASGVFNLMEGVASDAITLGGNVRIYTVAPGASLDTKVEFVSPVVKYGLLYSSDNASIVAPPYLLELADETASWCDNANWQYENGSGDMVPFNGRWSEKEKLPGDATLDATGESTLAMDGPVVLGRVILTNSAAAAKFTLNGSATLRAATIDLSKYTGEAHIAAPVSTTTILPNANTWLDATGTGSVTIGANQNLTLTKTWGGSISNPNASGTLTLAGNVAIGNYSQNGKLRVTGRDTVATGGSVEIVKDRPFVISDGASFTVNSFMCNGDNASTTVSILNGGKLMVNGTCRIAWYNPTQNLLWKIDGEGSELSANAFGSDNLYQANMPHLQVSNGGTLRMGAGGFQTTFDRGVYHLAVSNGTLAASANWTTKNARTLPTAIAHSSTLTFDPNGKTITFPCVISGSGSLVVNDASSAGNGTVKLTGENTFTGSATVARGTLAPGSASAISSASSLVLGAGGTLALGGIREFGVPLSAAAGAKITATVTDEEASALVRLVRVADGFDVSNVEVLAYLRGVALVGSSVKVVDGYLCVDTSDCLVEPLSATLTRSCTMAEATWKDATGRTIDYASVNWNFIGSIELFARSDITFTLASNLDSLNELGVHGPGRITLDGSATIPDLRVYDDGVVVVNAGVGVMETTGSGYARLLAPQGVENASSSDYPFKTAGTNSFKSATINFGSTPYCPQLLTNTFHVTEGDALSLTTGYFPYYCTGLFVEGGRLTLGAGQYIKQYQQVGYCGDGQGGDFRQTGGEVVFNATGTESNPTFGVVLYNGSTDGRVFHFDVSGGTCRNAGTYGLNFYSGDIAASVTGTGVMQFNSILCGQGGVIGTLDIADGGTFLLGTGGVSANAPAITIDGGSLVATGGAKVDAFISFGGGTLAAAAGKTLSVAPMKIAGAATLAIGKDAYTGRVNLTTTRSENLTISSGSVGTVSFVLTESEQARNGAVSLMKYDGQSIAALSVQVMISDGSRAAVGNVTLENGWIVFTPTETLPHVTDWPISATATTDAYFTDLAWTDAADSAYTGNFGDLRECDLTLADGVTVAVTNDFFIDGADFRFKGNAAEESDFPTVSLTVPPARASNTAVSGAGFVFDGVNATFSPNPSYTKGIMIGKNGGNPFEIKSGKVTVNLSDKVVKTTVGIRDTYHPTGLVFGYGNLDGYGIDDLCEAVVSGGLLDASNTYILLYNPGTVLRVTGTGVVKTFGLYRYKVNYEGSRAVVENGGTLLLGAAGIGGTTEIAANRAPDLYINEGGRVIAYNSCIISKNIRIGGGTLAAANGCNLNITAAPVCERGTVVRFGDDENTGSVSLGTIRRDFIVASNSTATLRFALTQSEELLGHATICAYDGTDLSRFVCNAAGGSSETVDLKLEGGYVVYDAGYRVSVPFSQSTDGADFVTGMNGNWTTANIGYDTSIHGYAIAPADGAASVKCYAVSPYAPYSDWTVSVYAKTGRALSNGVMLGLGGASAQGLALVSLGDDRVALSSHSGASEAETLLTADVPNAALQFHYYTIAYDASENTVSLYVDGAFSGIVTVEPVGDNTVSLFSLAGAPSGGNGYGIGAGTRVDDLWMWPEALDGETVRALSLQNEPCEKAGTTRQMVCPVTEPFSGTVEYVLTAAEENAGYAALAPCFLDEKPEGITVYLSDGVTAVDSRFLSVLGGHLIYSRAGDPVLFSFNDNYDPDDGGVEVEWDYDDYPTFKRTFEILDRSLDSETPLWGTVANLTANDWTANAYLQTREARPGETNLVLLAIGSSNEAGIVLVANAGHRVDVIYRAANGTSTTVISAVVPNATLQFHDYALVYESGTLTLYVDGAPAGLATVESVHADMLGLFKIPGGTVVNFASGASGMYLEDLVFYPTAFSAEGLASLIQSRGHSVMGAHGGGGGADRDANKIMDYPVTGKMKFTLTSPETNAQKATLAKTAETEAIAFSESIDIVDEYGRDLSGYVVLVENGNVVATRGSLYAATVNGNATGIFDGENLTYHINGTGEWIDSPNSVLEFAGIAESAMVTFTNSIVAGTLGATGAGNLAFAAADGAVVTVGHFDALLHTGTARVGFSVSNVTAGAETILAANGAGTLAIPAGHAATLEGFTAWGGALSAEDATSVLRLAGNEGLEAFPYAEEATPCTVAIARPIVMGSTCVIGSTSETIAQSFVLESGATMPGLRFVGTEGSSASFTVVSNATLTVAGGGISNERASDTPLTLGGGTLSFAANATVAGAAGGFVLSDDSTVHVGEGIEATVNAALAVGEDLTLTKTGAGTLVLNTVQGIAGVVHVENGIVRVAADASAVSFTVGENGTLEIVVSDESLAQSHANLFLSSQNASSLAGRVRVVDEEGNEPTYQIAVADGYARAVFPNESYYYANVLGDATGIFDETALAWSLSSDARGWLDSEDSTLTFTNTMGSATVTFTNAFTAESLEVVGNKPLTLALADGVASPTLARIIGTNTTATLTLGFSAGEIVAGADTVLTAGARSNGRLTIPAGMRATLYGFDSWGGTLNAVNNTSVLRYAGESALSSMPYALDNTPCTIAVARSVSSAALEIGAGNTSRVQNFIIEDGFSATVTQYRPGNGKGRCNVTQTGGTITVTGSGDGANNTTSPVLFSHWANTLAYTMTGGSITAANGVMRLSWDGTTTFNLGNGMGTALVDVKGLRNGDGRNNSATLTIYPNGKLRVGSVGIATPGSNTRINLAGGTLAFAATATASAANGFPVSAASTIEVEEGATATVASAITGAGNVTKTGAGSLVLSAASSNNGMLTVSAGRFDLNAAYNGSLSVADGATLAGSGSVAGGVAFANGASFVRSASGTMSVAGAVSLDGTVTVSLDGVAPTANLEILSCGTFEGTGEFVLDAAAQAAAEAANLRLVQNGTMLTFEIDTLPCSHYTGSVKAGAYVAYGFFDSDSIDFQLDTPEWIDSLDSTIVLTNNLDQTAYVMLNTSMTVGSMTFAGTQDIAFYMIESPTLTLGGLAGKGTIMGGATLADGATIERGAAGAVSVTGAVTLNGQVTVSIADGVALTDGLVLLSYGSLAGEGDFALDHASQAAVTAANMRLVKGDTALVLEEEENAQLPATMAFSYKPSPASLQPTGTWGVSYGSDKEPFSTTQLRVGPYTGAASPFVLQTTNGNHPWYGLSARTAAFTFAVYADIDAVPSSGKAVLVAFGANSGNKAILYREGGNVRLAWVNGSGGVIGTAATVAITSGYHLYTAVCNPTTGALKLYKGESGAAGGQEGAVALSQGFQIGSIFQGRPSGFGMGTNMALAGLFAWDEALAAGQVLTLAGEYPAVTGAIVPDGCTVPAGSTLTIDPNGSTLALTTASITGPGAVAIDTSTGGSVTMTVAEGETFTLGSPQISGAVAFCGDGTVVAANALPDGSLNFVNDNWRGTLVLRNVSVNNTATEFNPNNYGNSHSTLVLDGLGGLYYVTAETTVNPAVVIGAGGVSFDNGSSNKATTWRKISGSGTFSAGGNSTQGHIFLDSTNFTGNIVLNNKGLTFGSTSRYSSTSAHQNKIYVESGAVASVRPNASWTASAGIFVNGTINLVTDAAVTDGMTILTNAANNGTIMLDNGAAVTVNGESKRRWSLAVDANRKSLLLRVAPKSIKIIVH